MKRQECKNFLHQHSLIFDRSDYPIIEIGGSEHREWIHRISSQTSIDLKAGEVCTTALLNGTAGVISYFQMLILEDKVWILAEPQSKEKILKHLDFCHFGEDIYFKLVTVSSYFEVVGSATDLNLDPTGIVGAAEATSSTASSSGPTGTTGAQRSFVFAAEGWNAEGKICINITKPDLPIIDLETYRLIKRSRAWPIDQYDINEENVLLEASSLSHYATDLKGCYPGQEVIAKIITYQRVAKKYLVLWTDDDEVMEEDIFYKDGRAGKIIAKHPLEDGTLLLVYVLRVAADLFLQGKDRLKAGEKDLESF